MPNIFMWLMHLTKAELQKGNNFEWINASDQSRLSLSLEKMKLLDPNNIEAYDEAIVHIKRTRPTSYGLSAKNPCPQKVYKLFGGFFLERKSSTVINLIKLS